MRILGSERSKQCSPYLWHNKLRHENTVQQFLCKNLFFHYISWLTRRHNTKPFFSELYTKSQDLQKKGNGHKICSILLYIFFQHVSLSQILSILHFKVHGVYFLRALLNDDVNCYSYIALIINKCMNEYGML